MLKPDIELQQEARKEAIPADIASRRLDGYLPFGSLIREEDGSYTIFFRKNRNIDGFLKKRILSEEAEINIQKKLKEIYSLPPNKKADKEIKAEREKAIIEGRANSIIFLFPSEGMNPQMTTFYNRLQRAMVYTIDDIISNPKPVWPWNRNPVFKGKMKEAYNQIREIIMSEQTGNSQT